MTCIKPTIKLIEACNFTCEYCEYKMFSNTQKDRVQIDPELAIRIAKESIEINKCNGKTTCICWHGGEPLLYPIKTFEYILKEIDKYAKEINASVEHSIQTNGYLINDEWIGIFDYFRIKVGVSLDGPESINGNQREKGTVEKILQNIQKLNKHNCFNGVLTVLTENHKGREAELLDFYRANGIDKVGFCKSFNSDMTFTISNETLTEFLINFFDLYMDASFPLNIREYNVYISKILKRRTINYCFASCREACGTFLTFNPNGDIFLCDDSYMSKNKIANISECSIADVVRDPCYLRKQTEIRKVLECGCHACEYLSICGAGCYRNDVDNHERNYYCSTYKKLISHIKKRLDGI